MFPLKQLQSGGLWNAIQGNCSKQALSLIDFDDE
jgi:hypothetical protein